MTKWRVAYVPIFEDCLDGIEDSPSVPPLQWLANPRKVEIPCYRVFPEGEPERWIAETNSDLPQEVQEEFALILADALSQLLGD